MQYTETVYKNLNNSVQYYKQLCTILLGSMNPSNAAAFLPNSYSNIVQEFEQFSTVLQAIVHNIAWLNES
jgi:hypothetical protein